MEYVDKIFARFHEWSSGDLRQWWFYNYASILSPTHASLGYNTGHYAHWRCRPGMSDIDWVIEASRLYLSEWSNQFPPGITSNVWCVIICRHHEWFKTPIPDELKQLAKTWEEEKEIRTKRRLYSIQLKDDFTDWWSKNEDSVLDAARHVRIKELILDPKFRGNVSLEVCHKLRNGFGLTLMQDVRRPYMLQNKRASSGTMPQPKKQRS